MEAVMRILPHYAPVLAADFFVVDDDLFIQTRDPTQFLVSVGMDSHQNLAQLHSRISLSFEEQTSEKFRAEAEKLSLGIEKAFP